MASALTVVFVPFSRGSVVRRHFVSPTRHTSHAGRYLLLPGNRRLGVEGVMTTETSGGRGSNGFRALHVTTRFLGAAVSSLLFAALYCYAQTPGPVTYLGFRHAQVIEWTPVSAAQTYDVVLGDLGQLRSSGGDFTASTQGCLVSGTTGTSVAFNATPSIGQGFWILVRGSNSSGAGTYDSDDPHQVGSRDSEIDASPLACGNQTGCGD